MNLVTALLHVIFPPPNISNHAFGKGFFLSTNRCALAPLFESVIADKQGRIHGTSVADGWTRAVMQKPLAIQV